MPAGNYVLITPVRNEETYIPLHMESILAQTVKPRLWVIVDGNSTDKSRDLVKSIGSQVDWIYLLEQKESGSGDDHLSFSLGVREGYDEVCRSAHDLGLEYDYVAKMDADVILPPKFFQHLIEKFREDPLLGMASGTTYTLSENTLPGNASWDDVVGSKPDCPPPGELPDKRLLRRECLEEAGGFPVTKYSPDTVLLAMVKLRGWKAKTFKDVKMYNLRGDTGIERNLWRSYLKKGRARYYLDYHPLFILVTALYMGARRPHYHFIPFLVGYFSSLFRGEEQIDDLKLKDYFRHSRPREMICEIFKNCKLRIDI